MSLSLTDNHQIEFETFLHGSSMDLIGKRDESNVRTDLTNSRRNLMIFRLRVSTRSSQFRDRRAIRRSSRGVGVRRRRERSGGRIASNTRIERRTIISVGRGNVTRRAVKNGRLMKIFQGDSTNGFVQRRRWRGWRGKRRSDRWGRITCC